MSANHYGTYDQGGNVWEWNDAVIGSKRGWSGGAWLETEVTLRSSFRFSFTLTGENGYLGFRVASVPEPGSLASSVSAASELLTPGKTAEPIEKEGFFQGWAICNRPRSGAAIANRRSCAAKLHTLPR